MRYVNTDKKVDSNANTELPKEKDATFQNKTKQQPDEMKNFSDDVLDRLQADIVNAGERALSLLNKKKYIGEEESKQTYNKLQDLRNFYYEIGFAGGQSAGKSTLINALIQYPLLPTCKQATTCTPVELLFSEKIRILVKDDDAGKIVLDYPCDKASQKDFQKLLAYTCAVSAGQAMENLQPFTSVNVKKKMGGLALSDLEMSFNNPRHVAVLWMILLTVYEAQNQENMSERQKSVLMKRDETLQYFGIKKSNINISVVIQWDSPILKSGLRIIDLPGLGSNAEDQKLQSGKNRKGHTTITEEAIRQTDSMVLLCTEEVNGMARPALKEMVSNLILREAVDPGNCIIPVMNINASDMNHGQVIEKGLNDFADMINEAGSEAGIIKKPEDIHCCTAIFGEYAYKNLEDKTRTLYVMDEISEAYDEDYSEEEIRDEIDRSLKKFEKKYKKCGIEELREFFHRGFIEQKKYEKEFSTIASMKSLETDLTSGIKALLETDQLFADISEEVATDAIKKLKDDAISPMNEIMKDLSELVEQQQKKSSYVSSSIDLTVEKYRNAITSAIQKYEDKNLAIAKKFKHSLNPIHVMEAEIERNTNNHDVYQELQSASSSISVDLSSVNAEFAKALRYCDEDIEYIYQRAGDQMKSFQKKYKETLQTMISRYQKDVDSETLKILNAIIPVIDKMMREEMDSAENSMKNARKEIKEAEKDLAADIISLNGTFTQKYADYARQPIERTAKGVWSDNCLFVKVWGNDGIIRQLETLKPSEEDIALMEDSIRTACQENILSKINQWYVDAEVAIKDVFVNLVQSISAYLNETEEMLKKNASDRQGSLEEHRKNLIDIQTIFGTFKSDIRNCVLEALQIKSNGIYRESVGPWLGAEEESA